MIRPDWRILCAALITVAVGSIAAPAYLRRVAPCYLSAARLIARGEPWQIVDVAVEPSTDKPGMIQQLSALVSGGDARHTRHAQLLGKVHAGAAIEPLLTFWLVLLAWPAVSAKQRWVRILMGAPVFILTDAATTIVSLMHALPWAQNTLAGLPDVPTGWDRWVDFLEAGGRFAISVSAALLTIAAAAQLPATRRARRDPAGGRLPVAGAAQDCNSDAL